jgi:exodeoxyribonuclease VII small subunit
MRETKSEAVAQPGAIADFEKSLDELESLVARMEKGDLTLEDSVKAFERGMLLYQNCQQALNEAELRVDLLLKGNDPNGRVRLDPETP